MSILKLLKEAARRGHLPSFCQLLDQTCGWLSSAYVRNGAMAEAAILLRGGVGVVVYIKAAVFLHGGT